MKKMTPIKALNDIQDSYDAFYIANKYGDDGTHKKEFDILFKFVKDDDLGKRALNWIKHEYDCYYKEDYSHDENSPFAYLEKLIKEGEE
jgi:hypothetical protein